MNPSIAPDDAQSNTMTQLVEVGYLLEIAGQLRCLDSDGVIAAFTPEEHGEAHWVCLDPDMIRRYCALPQLSLVDFAELWTFSFPLVSPPRTVATLAEAMGIALTGEGEEQLLLLPRGVEYALHALGTHRKDDILRGIVAYLYQAHWIFGAAAAAQLGLDEIDCIALGEETQALNIFKALRKWHRPPAGRGDLGQSISPEEATRMLQAQLPSDSEQRSTQVAYTEAVQKIFSAQSQIAREDGLAHLHLLQAGTGVGKTLGYLAPARLWAERNDEAVWVSTYSRHLQDQIATTMWQLAPSKDVVIRKGRENYLCLLNYEETLGGGLARDSEQRLILGLIARWITATREGIMIGADFPLWLEERADPHLLQRLRLKRGECIYSACPHYARCFLEGAEQRSRDAKVIIANHALSLRQASRGRLDYSRVIIDEAHQLFDATDSATRLRLGLVEAWELQRWFLGAKRDSSRRLRRSLNERLADLELSEEAANSLQKLLQSCAFLGGVEGRAERVQNGAGIGVLEEFFQQIVIQMTTESVDNPREQGFALEAPLRDAMDSPLRHQGAALYREVTNLHQLLHALLGELNTMLDAVSDDNPDGESLKLSAHILSIEEYPLQQLQGWSTLLRHLVEENSESPPSPEPNNELIADSAVIERLYLQPANTRHHFAVGLEMAFRDPTEILPHWLYSTPRKAIVLTSASLSAAENDPKANWHFANLRTGLHHLGGDARVHREAFASPFDYTAQVRVFVASDMVATQTAECQRAMQACFRASGGGGLGLFTAIRRAEACFRAIRKPLAEAGISLYSQHDDVAGNMLLSEYMRRERDACLIATDAFRDGVDIPGEALRLVVLERLPWPRPDLVHRHRRLYFGTQYDREIVRQRLMQAFGRLIRSTQDRGCFVLLDRRFPSDLEDCFPVQIERLPLQEILTALQANAPQPLKSHPNNN